MADLRRSNRKRHKTVPIEDSSSSGEEINAQKTTPRSSERLQKRRSCEFRLPTREELWEKITPTKSPGKYDHLRPRKLVNNFTKENNRYNYDPNETSGEESMEDFIVDDDELEEDSSSEEEEVKTQNTPCRIKGRHRRFHSVPDSDASSSSEEDLSSHEPSHDLSHDSAMEDDDVNLECDRHSNKRVKVSRQKEHEDEYSDSNDETGNDRVKRKLATRKSRYRSIIESDNSDDLEENDTKKVKRIMKKKDDVPNSDRSETDELSSKLKGSKAPVIESDEIDSGGGSGEDGEYEYVIFATRRVANHKRSFIESEDENLNADHSATPAEIRHVNGDMVAMATCHSSKKDCSTKSKGVSHNQNKTDPNPLVKIEKEETDIHADTNEMKVSPEQNLRIKLEKPDDGFPNTEIKEEICESQIFKSENEHESISKCCSSNEVDKNSESESSDPGDDGSHDSEDDGSHDSEDEGSHDDDGSHGLEDEGSCESDDEFDEEVYSGRVRIGMLRKKQRTKQMIEQLRQERERKLLRQNKKS